MTYTAYSTAANNHEHEIEDDKPNIYTIPYGKFV
jgi:hypothetical protein